MRALALEEPLWAQHLIGCRACSGLGWPSEMVHRLQVAAWKIYDATCASRQITAGGQCLQRAACCRYRAFTDKDGAGRTAHSHNSQPSCFMQHTKSLLIACSPRARGNCILNMMCLLQICGVCELAVSSGSLGLSAVPAGPLLMLYAFKGCRCHHRGPVVNCC